MQIKKETTFNLRISHKQKELLRLLADKNQRSMADYLLLLLILQIEKELPELLKNQERKK